SPEPRYFSIPSTVDGGAQRSSSALNCSPCCGSNTQAPVASTYSPALTLGTAPTTVTSPRRPRAWTRSTAQPDSGLWKVTRSTVPDSRSPIPAFYRAGEGKWMSAGARGRPRRRPLGEERLQPLAALRRQPRRRAGPRRLLHRQRLPRELPQQPLGPRQRLRPALRQ